MPKAPHVTIDAIVGGLILDISPRSAMKYRNITKTLSPRKKSELIASIHKTAAAKRTTQPGVALLCDYVIKNFANIELTDQNVDVIFSCAFGHCSESEKRANGDGKMINVTYYAIPETGFFGDLIKGGDWKTSKGVESRPELVGGVFEVTIGLRPHFVGLVFDESAPQKATGKGASLAVINKIVDKKKAKEE
jgi:hypothetical protein